MKKWIAVIVFFAVVASRPSLAQEGGGSTPGKTQAAYGGTLVVGVTGDADTFNPLFSESSLGQDIMHLLLLGLADLNEKSEFKPELAARWEHSKDYLKLTYHLRTDAKWSDGAPITAEDVKFTYDLLMDTTVASPRQGSAEYVKSVTVDDAYTVTFTFTEPYPDQVFDTAGEILPKHILAKADHKSLRSHAFGRAPISSGPFILKSWQSKQYLELVANKDFFGGRPYLDRVIFKIVPDETNLFLQLKTGEIDMMLSVPPTKAQELAKQPARIAIYPMAGRVYYYLGYNTANPLFAAANVRRALTMAIDRQGLVQALLYGYGAVCHGPVPPMLAWAYNGDIVALPYDPKLSARTLAAAGWQDRDGDGWLEKDGHVFEFDLLSNTGNQLRSDLAVIIQDQLQKIGVRVNIQSLEWTSYLKKLRDPALSAFLGGWSTAFNVDPTPVFHSTASDLFNYGHYANTDVDRLIDLGRKAMDQPSAARIWQEFQKRLYDDQPYTFLFWIDKVAAVNTRIKNATPISLSPLYGLEKWYVESTSRVSE